MVYYLTCPCGLLYVGGTICTLRKHFGEHRRFIEEGNDIHVPKHFLVKHLQSTADLKVWVIEAIPNSLPAAEHFKPLCQHKTF